jgi:hypothetical protein
MSVAAEKSIAERLANAPTGENRDKNVEEEIKDFYADYAGLKERYDLKSKIGEGKLFTFS